MLPLDDRGQACGVTDRLLDGKAAEADHEAESHWEGERLQRSLDFRHRPMESLAFASCVFGPAVLLGAAISTHWWLGWPRWLGWAIGIGAVASLFPIWMRWDQRLRFRVARESFLRRELCPACAYPLGDAEEQPDGRVVCPECGAAWRVPGDEVGGVQ